MITPEAIRKVFEEKYDDLMAHGHYTAASIFALKTQKIAMDALKERNVLGGDEIPEMNITRRKLLAYLDKAILKAEVAAYNVEWRVDLKIEPEKEDTSDAEDK